MRKRIARLIAVCLSSVIGVFLIAVVVIPSVRRSPCACITEEMKAGFVLKYLNRGLVKYQPEEGFGFPDDLTVVADDSGYRVRSTIVDPAGRTFQMSGYRYLYTPGPRKSGDITTYTIIAEPLNPSPFGGSRRSYFTDESGVIRVSLKRRATASDPPV